MNDQNKKEIVQSQPTEITNLDDILEYIPEEKRENAEVVVSQMISKSYSGPVPQAEEMKKYQQIDPDFPNRLLIMAEKQSSHRQAMEADVISKGYDLKKRGQNYAIGGLVLLASLAAYLINVGAHNAAATVASISIVAVVGIFVTGRYNPSKSEEEEESDLS